MALFKRRSPDTQDEGYSSTAQNQPPQQYGDSSTTSQYESSGGTTQYETTNRNPQYETTNAAPQYETTSRNQQYERTGRANQPAWTPRNATLTPRGLPGGWIGEIILGLATVVIGLIVVAHPMHSLNVLAILLGVLMIVSGVYYVVRSLRRAGDHRMWSGIAGVVFFLVGIFLLRHVSLTVALIALFAGFAFIIGGIAALAEAISGRGSMGRIWSALLGVLAIFAGIAAITTPIHTLARLAIVLGWAFFVIGIMQIIGAVVSWRTLREESRREREQITVPGQRATEATDVEGAYGAPTEAQASASGAPKHRRSRL